MLLRPRRYAILTLVAGTVACPRPAEVWIVGQAGASRPIFGIGSTREGRPTYLSHFSVRRCSDQGTIVWHFSGSSDSPRLSRIEYPVLPPGYVRGSNRSQKDPTPSTLAPGCYIAITDGSGAIKFEVAGDGMVRERAWSDSLP